MQAVASLELHRPAGHTHLVALDERGAQEKARPVLESGARRRFTHRAASLLHPDPDEPRKHLVLGTQHIETSSGVLRLCREMRAQQGLHSVHLRSPQ